MRSRRIAAAALALSLLFACSGDDDAAEKTTTTSGTGPAATLTTAKPHTFAALVVQIDDRLRGIVRDSATCIDPPHTPCEGDARKSFEFIDDVSAALGDILRSAINQDDKLYVGELPPDLVALYDESQSVSARAASAAEAAVAACLPKVQDSCDEAAAALDGALESAYKNMNHWRERL
jgi:hypothetical protein